MHLNLRRFALAAAAVGLLATAGIDGAFAQGATVAPGAGVGSTTAPSNSQGTPSGGTGVVGTTRVGPSTETARPAPRARTRRPARRARPSSSSIATPAFFG